MWLNTLLLALRSIRRNLMRSFLTILGIVIGVSAVITMVTVGNGATLSVQNQIAGLGTNLLQIRPGQRMGGPGGSGAPSFREADAIAIRSQVSGLLAVAAEGRTSATIVADGRNWGSSVIGSTNDWLVTGNWKLSEGRSFSDDEERGGASVCLVGQTIQRELFSGNSALGAFIRVKQITCEVIGVLGSKGQGAFGNDQDDVVLVPLHTLQRRITGNLRINTLLVSMVDGADPERVKATLTELLRERRKLAEADEDNFNVLDTKQLGETFASTTKVMTMLLGAVAAVSLLVGGIGIMNIMLVSVTERTREIGLRLAIGALEGEVLLQFLIEAVVLSALGGLIGIVLATGASIGLARLMDVPYVFNVGVNLLSFVFSAAIGVLFGYVPARRAARLDPIEALRHE
ncbi:ABC transporter permease [Rhodoferax fermentans]|uniref:Multidrug ABC transporter substrate-binding protein n=1 Tax=Rhodoferax fermentans TaxID=28066 RepID=A0A1T1APH8_RHOFE|nr:ABC transporter permease [Rhodoferax fermentans]MBK1684872.1 multidrug ABC transporter substrate-binding protein [Rhodoferax fermentans]OOV05994.1 multidrug ABC transporter substrate-binding protein [Rhodoferax fermentans]